MSHWIAYFIEKDPPVSFPVSGSRKESFRQHSVGRPTSYLMPTIFINSCSWTPQIKRRMIEINQFLIRRHHPHTLEPWGQCTAFHFLLINSVFFSLRESRRWHSKFFKLRKVMLQCCLACLFKRPKKKRNRRKRCASHVAGNTFTKMHTVPAMHYRPLSAQKLLFSSSTHREEVKNTREYNPINCYV